MEDAGNATFLVLSAKPLPASAHEALVASAHKLGHADAAFAFTASCTPRDVAMLVHRFDPWSVVAVDEESVEALKAAFAKEAADFGPDHPTMVRGYRFVAVPGFAQCLEDQEAKRAAWQRLKAAQHPGAPY